MSSLNQENENHLSTAHGLNFEQSVPRSLAHRASVAEVYVTDTCLAGTDEFLAAIQIPRAHSVWFDRLVMYHDPLSTVEAVRQAVMVVGQRYLGLPGDAPVSLQKLDFFVEDISAYEDDRAGPLQGIVRLRPSQQKQNTATGFLKEVSFDASLTINGKQALTVQGSGIAFPREAYDGFRRVQQSIRSKTSGDRLAPAEPLDHRLVGRRDQRNVVIGKRADPGEAANQFVLIVDQCHPFFFDHTYDHVPSHLFLEAVRQTAIVVAMDAGALKSPAAVVSSVHIEFTGYAELADALELYAGLDFNIEADDISVFIRLMQGGRDIANGSVELIGIFQD